MKKYFCFYCQENIEPRKILFWRFCPQCRHYMTDDGEGFYRVCDHCGANMPADGKYCRRCKTSVNGQSFLELKNTWLQGLVGIALIFASVMFCLFIGLGFLYLLIYLVPIFFIAGLLYIFFKSLQR